MENRRNESSPCWKSQGWVLAVTIVYFLVLLIGVSFHELWRDEAAAWLTARDTHSISQLLLETSYNAHPSLWYILLVPLTQFAPPIAMQLLNVALGTIATYIFVRFAPFNRLWKLVFVFGYYPLFEYGMISRCYMLEWLLLSIFCALYQFQRQRFWLQCLVLALLCHTIVYGAIIAIALFCMIVWERARSAYGVQDSDVQPSNQKSNCPRFLLSCAIFAVGVLTAAWSMIPPHDTGADMGWFRHPHDNFMLMLISASSILRAYLPLPVWGLHFWNRNLLFPYDNAGLFVLSTGLSVIAFIVAISIFRTNRQSLMVYLLATMGWLVFSYTPYYLSQRHYGQLYFILIICAWLRSMAATSSTGETNSPSLKSSRLAAITFGAVLVVNLASGIYAYGADILYPFSAGKELARYLDQNVSPGAIIVAEPDLVGSSVAVYSNHPIFFVRGQRFGTFAREDNKSYPEEKDPVFQTVRRLQTQTKREVLVMFAPQFPKMVPGFWKEAIPFLSFEDWQKHFTLNKQFSPSIEKTEEFMLLKLKPEYQH